MGKLVVANYKMNGDKNFYQTVQNKFNNLKLQDTKIILCPPFVYLSNFSLSNKNIELGAQNISSKTDNKSTGEISPIMLRDFNVKYCLIGHVERRNMGEDLNLIKEKISNAICMASEVAFSF